MNIPKGYTIVRGFSLGNITKPYDLVSCKIADQSMISVWEDHFIKKKAAYVILKSKKHVKLVVQYEADKEPYSTPYITPTCFKK